MKRFTNSLALLSLTVVSWWSASHVTDGFPTSHRHQRSRSHHHRRHIPTPPDTLPFRSDLVRFAAHRPVLPPWSVVETEDSASLPSGRLDFTDNVNENRTGGTEAVSDIEEEDVLGRGRRVRRSVHSRVTLPSRPADGSDLEPVCQSESGWIQRTEAEDYWGNSVRILQEIDNGSTRVNQYFYETYCAQGSGRRRRSCTGIDLTMYDSFCHEQHVWAYAKVADYSLSGDGWTFVKIRSSCNCGLKRKRSHRVHSLHDIAG